MTPRQKVLDTYPTAYVQQHKSTAALLHVVRAQGKVLGEGRTSADAWADAAKNIVRPACVPTEPQTGSATRLEGFYETSQRFGASISDQWWRPMACAMWDVDDEGRKRLGAVVLRHNGKDSLLSVVRSPDVPFSILGMIDEMRDKLTGCGLSYEDANEILLHIGEWVPTKQPSRMSAFWLGVALFVTAFLVIPALFLGWPTQ